MDEQFKFDHDRYAYIMIIRDADSVHRITVPIVFIDEELGGTATASKREAWIKTHFTQILETYTARQSGGVVTAPWGRVIVEEID